MTFLFSSYREYHQPVRFCYPFLNLPFLREAFVPFSGVGSWSVHCFDFEVFIEVFFPLLAFCPYHIGHFSLVGLGFEEHVSIILLQT